MREFFLNKRPKALTQQGRCVQLRTGVTNCADIINPDESFFDARILERKIRVQFDRTEYFIIANNFEREELKESIAYNTIACLVAHGGIIVVVVCVLEERGKVGLRQSWIGYSFC